MKVVYLCHFSNALVRQHLDLKGWKLRNRVLALLHHAPWQYFDYAVWNTDFIAEFEKHDEIEFHIISPHHGMKKSIQHFDVNKIHYHFFKDDGCLLSDFTYAKLRLNEKTDYRKNRIKINKIISGIKPDLVVLCGAECPNFAISLLDIKNIPTYVILQTCINLQKYIDIGVGSNYMRQIEKMVFKKSKFFGTSSNEYFDKYIEFNKDAICLSIKFPSHQPPTYEVEKEYDFVFFGRIVVNKGIEETIKALSKVIKTHPNARLNIIGTCAPEYKTKLQNMIYELKLADNIVFSNWFESMDDLYCQVQKSRCAVLPGITAPLNSTVRESMFMNLPTIVFDHNTISNINANKQCLLAAEMLNVDDLASKMIFSIENTEAMAVIADNAYQYAKINFSNTKIGDKIVANMEAIYHYHKKGTPIPENLLLDIKESL